MAWAFEPSLTRETTFAPGGRGHVAGGVVGAVVDDDDLADVRDTRRHAATTVGDRRLLVARGDDGVDGHALEATRDCA